MQAIKNLTSRTALFIAGATPFVIVADMVARAENSFFAMWLINTTAGL